MRFWQLAAHATLVVWCRLVCPVDTCGHSLDLALLSMRSALVPSYTPTLILLDSYPLAKVTTPSAKLHPKPTPSPLYLVRPTNTRRHHQGRRRSPQIVIQRNHRWHRRGYAHRCARVVRGLETASAHLHKNLPRQYGSRDWRIPGNLDRRLHRGHRAEEKHARL